MNIRIWFGAGLLVLIPIASQAENAEFSCSRPWAPDLRSQFPAREWRELVKRKPPELAAAALPNILHDIDCGNIARATLRAGEVGMDANTIRKIVAERQQEKMRADSADAEARSLQQREEELTTIREELQARLDEVTQKRTLSGNVYWDSVKVQLEKELFKNELGLAALRGDPEALARLQRVFEEEKREALLAHRKVLSDARDGDQDAVLVLKVYWDSPEYLQDLKRQAWEGDQDAKAELALRDEISLRVQKPVVHPPPAKGRAVEVPPDTKLIPPAKSPGGAP